MHEKCQQKQTRTNEETISSAKQQTTLSDKCSMRFTKG